MWRIAIDMLLNDRAKYYTLISVLSFSTLLITEQMGIFVGIVDWMSSQMLNANVPIWVMDPLVQQIDFVKRMPENDLIRVRSVKGVEWAFPYYHSLLDVHVPQGEFMPAHVIGLDDSTLVGLPQQIIQGKASDLWGDNTVMIDKIGIEKLSKKLKRKLGIGDIVNIRDHEMKIVGVVKALPVFDGHPLIYTTYNRSIILDPSSIKHLSYILVKPVEGTNIPELLKRIQKQTGLLALTQAQFSERTIRWYFENSGLLIGVVSTTLLGFFVGLIISAQTFYSFINDNVGNLSALKAMGISNAKLLQMILLQTATAGIIGFGIGMVFSTLLGYAMKRAETMPFDLPWQLELITFAMILLICSLAALVAYNRVRKLEPSEVFRG